MKSKWVLRIASIAATLLAIWTSIDLYVNYQYNLTPQLHDGFCCITPLARLIYRDERWSVELFKNGFIAALVMTAVLLIATVAIIIITTRKKKA